MRIHTKTHNTKNTRSHFSPNAYLVQSESHHKIGASGATYFAKKNINPIRINPIPIWYLLILKVDLDLERLLLLAKTHKMKINNYKISDIIFHIFFNSKLTKNSNTFQQILIIINDNLYKNFLIINWKRNCNRRFSYSISSCPKFCKNLIYYQQETKQHQRRQ